MDKQKGATFENHFFYILKYDYAHLCVTEKSEQVLSMAKQIIMAVTNDLLTDQRVNRTCTTLQEAGYAVTLVGRHLPESPRMEPRPYRCVRMRLLFRRSALFYAEYNVRLLLKLLATPADLFYSNDTDTLLACCWAARLRKKPLVFDAHELFPEVPELVDKPFVRRVWRGVERRCLPHVSLAFTVSRPVADEYYRRYGIKMKVLRNVPQCATFEPLVKRVGEWTTLLYQGAVNVGRGVRELVDVMELLPDCRLVVAGDGDLLETLQSYAATKPWVGRIEFLGRVTPQRLHLLTQQADLGLCLLEELGLSYRYALPNRIGDYARAGVPVLATGFEAIKEVVGHYGIGTLTEACPHKKEGEEYEAYLGRLAAAVRGTLDYWQALPQEEKSRRFAQAQKELCWDSEKKILLQGIDTIIEKKLR